MIELIKALAGDVVDFSGLCLYDMDGKPFRYTKEGQYFDPWGREINPVGQISKVEWGPCEGLENQKGHYDLKTAIVSVYPEAVRQFVFNMLGTCSSCLESDLDAVGKLIEQKQKENQEKEKEKEQTQIPNSFEESLDFEGYAPQGYQGSDEDNVPSIQQYLDEMNEKKQS